MRRSIVACRVGVDSRALWATTVCSRVPWARANGGMVTFLATAFSFLRSLAPALTAFVSQRQQVAGCPGCHDNVATGGQSPQQALGCRRA